MIIKTSYIMLTNPCNLYSLIPHFYIVKLGYTNWGIQGYTFFLLNFYVYLFFIIFFLICDLSKNKNMSQFFI